MKFVNKRIFQSKLQQRFPGYNGGWLYGCLDDAFLCKSYNISARAKLKTLISKTQNIASALGSRYPSR